jgi:hypothetical protein
MVLVVMAMVMMMMMMHLTLWLWLLYVASIVLQVQEATKVSCLAVASIVQVVREGPHSDPRVGYPWLSWHVDTQRLSFSERVTKPCEDKSDLKIL